MNLSTSAAAAVGSAVLATQLALTLTVPAEPAAARQAEATEPAVSHLRTLRTTPFPGTALSMQDHEGVAYVPRDNSLWLSDDEARRLYEVDARTGALKRVLPAKQLAAVRRFRGERTAGHARTRDLEGLAYDATSDRLYAFNGADCKPSTATCRWRSRPTAFRLTRVGGRFRPTSYQPLPAKTQPTGAAAHPVTGRLYVVDGTTLRAYRYPRNVFGPSLPLPGDLPAHGATFTPNGRALLVGHGGSARISRLAWPARSLVWTADLSKLGVRDARGIAQAGRRLFVSDGYDDRPRRSPLRYAVFVVKVR